MKKILISYGDVRFKKSLKRIKKEAKSLGLFDKIITYNPSKLPKEVTNSILYKYERGGGYWCWKPYIIWKTMQLYPNAIVVYVDAGCTLQPNYKEWEYWFSLMESTNTLVTRYRLNLFYNWMSAWHTTSVDNVTWTKKQTIDYFFDHFEMQNNLEILYFGQVISSFVMAKSNSSVIERWYDIMKNHPELVIDVFDDELKEQSTSFIEHRHDQSILSLLSYCDVLHSGKEVIIIDETSESDADAAVLATRLKDVPPIPFNTKLIKYIKLLIGEILYKKIHHIIFDHGCVNINNHNKSE